MRIRIGRALTFPQVEAASPQLAAAVTDRIWPNVMLQWEWLGGLPPLRRAAVIGAGSWGTAVAVMLARAGLEVDLGCRTREQADSLIELRRNERYLDGIELPANVNVLRASELEPSRHDLVVFAVPSSQLPAAVAAHGGQVAPRSGVLVCAKGLVPPLGTLPTAYVSERVPSWAVGALGGPAHAAAALNGGASLVLATAERRLLAPGRRRARPPPASTSRRPPTSSASSSPAAPRTPPRSPPPRPPAPAPTPRAPPPARCSPRSTPTRAAPARAPRPSPASPAPATSSPPCSRPARATAAPASCSPRASPPATSGPRSARPRRPSTACRCSPERVREAGVDAPVLRGLAGMIEGRVEPESWAASLTAPKPAGRRDKAKAA